MSRAVFVPAAVWIVTVSPGATLAPLGRAAVAEPARSRQPARSTAALPLFWIVVDASADVTWTALIRTGEAADAGTAGDAAAATVATTGEAPATAVATAGDAAAAGVVAAGEAAATTVAAAGEAAMVTTAAVGALGVGVAAQALSTTDIVTASPKTRGSIDSFTALNSNSSREATRHPRSGTVPPHSATGV